MLASARQQQERHGGTLSVASGVILAATALVAFAGQSSSMDARLDALYGMHEPYREFLRELQRAVAQDARAQVAALVSYPLKVRLAGHWVTVRTPAQFVVRYDRLLPPDSRAALSLQSYDSLFANSKGVMVGNGQLWFGGVCEDPQCRRQAIRIIALNPQQDGLSSPGH